MATVMSLPRGLSGRVRHLAHELAKFGVVGACAYLVDVGSFNLLRYGLDGGGPLRDAPLTAKIVSTVLATTVAFVGNRQWTFRRRGGPGMRRQYSVFFLLNAIGLGIALGCLGFSHYVLGLTSPLADNVSANIVGMILGTIFRFWSYRRFVFPHPPATDEAPVREPAGAATG